MKKILAALLALLPALAFGQAYPLFGPANGVLKGSTATYQTSSAVASDIVSLFSTCSDAQYLGADGACHSVLATPVTAANGGTGEAGTITGIPKANGTSAFTAAAAADVYGLWSGTCNSGSYLNGAGACTTPAGTSSGANPTASVGLTAVNGSAGTFLRSDGAPALDVTIAPTWTGLHTWSHAAPANILTVTSTGTGGQFGMSVNHTGTVSNDLAYYRLTAGTSTMNFFLANQNQSAALFTGGPTGTQGAIGTSGSYPLVFGVNNTFAGQIPNGGFVSTFNYCTTACNVGGLPKGQSAWVVKGTTTNRLSVTVSAIDPDLQFTSVPAGTYYVTVYLNGTTGGSGGGLKWQLSSNQSGVAYFPGVNICNGSAVAIDGGLSAVTCTVTNNLYGANVNGTIAPGATATLGITWAQNSSVAVNSSILAGSYMVITRLN